METEPKRREPRLLVVLVFLFLGPPLGAAAIGAYVFVACLLEGEAPQNALGLALLMTMVAAAGSFIYGGIPALLTGIVAALTRRHINGPAYFGLIAVVGAATSAGIGLFTDFGPPSITALIGVPPALLCAWMTRPRGSDD
jgi:hypothetical protein